MWRRFGRGASCLMLNAGDAVARRGDAGIGESLYMTATWRLNGTRQGHNLQ